MRTKNKWSVKLQRQDGGVVDRTFEAHWDPDREGINEKVGIAAAIAEWWRSNKAHQFAPLEVTRS